MTLRRYERYKDSGVEWLGHVPADWEVFQLRRVIVRIEQGWSPECESRPAEEGEWGVLKTGCVNGGRFNPFENKALPSHLDAPPGLEVAPGDLLMSRASGSPELVGSAALVIQTPTRLLLSDKTFRLHVNQRVHKDFLAWCLSSRPLRAQIECAISGAAGLANNLPQSSLLEFVAPFPSLQEQIAIAAYLGRETAKIDALIAEQRRLIELLTEKRQAVIAQAVTKGLDPSAPMKDSGVEWLGFVPSHWSVMRLGNLFEQVDQRGDDSLPVLSVSIHDGVSDAELDDAELDRKVTRSDDRTKYKRVAAGDLVYNMMRAWQGGFGTVTVEGMVSPAYVVARPKGVAPSMFIERLLRTPSAVEEMRRHSRGVTDFRLRLYWDEFKNIAVAWPPNSEAMAINRHVAAVEGKIAEVIAAGEDCIRVLRERRTALISAAISGQIDVRPAAPLDGVLSHTAANCAAVRYG